MGGGDRDLSQVGTVFVSCVPAAHIGGAAAGRCGALVVDYPAVPAAKPLSQCQFEVLLWIAAECPERD